MDEVANCINLIRWNVSQYSLANQDILICSTTLRKCNHSQPLFQASTWQIPWDNQASSRQGLELAWFCGRSYTNLYARCVSHYRSQSWFHGLQSLLHFGCSSDLRLPYVVIKEHWRFHEFLHPETRYCGTLPIPWPDGQEGKTSFSTTQNRSDF